MMTKKRLRCLLLALRAGTISASEFDELATFLQDNPDDEEVGLIMQEVAELADTDQVVDVPTQAMYEQIISDPRYRSAIRPGAKKSKMWPGKIQTLAATITAAILVSVLLYVYRPSNPENLDFKAGHLVGSSVPEAVISPGSKQALLTLADGTTIPLDSLEGRTVVTDDGIRLSMQDGQLAYEKTDNRVGELTNTISTPLGGEYEVILPDGTRVWLNAASSITYPISFVSDKREVKMSGEVYFEVKKDAGRLFIVKVGETRIQVLGTSFNVSAYEDEHVVRTTLLAGIVQVDKGNHNRMLKPGQQAETTDSRNGIDVKDVDTEEAVAWKNGYFHFNNEHVADAMRKIGRWYNVDIQYEGKIPDKGLDGTISKMADLHQLLRALEMTAAAKFELKERRIIVKEY